MHPRVTDLQEIGAVWRGETVRATRSGRVVVLLLLFMMFVGLSLTIGIGAAPDLTVRALQAELPARGTPASYGAVWRILARKGLTLKE